ncbi:MAG: crossover junction endodeoxyribonuclease RuvC [Endomicrobia bacterium]|nr:crossover junction endodeoxyribonuclease RuvC [Endomicrobiia bacterium]
MKVLGIDPGLASCGWAVIEKSIGKKYKLISCGEIKTKSYNLNFQQPNLSIEKRLKSIFLELKKIFLQYKPDIACIESQFYSKIAKNMINTYLAVGVIYLLCGLQKIPVKEFSAKTVKLAISGYGSASKLQLRKMVKLLLQHETEICSQHINDAIAVALCYLTTQETQTYV